MLFETVMTHITSSLRRTTMVPLRRPAQVTLLVLSGGARVGPVVGDMVGDAVGDAVGDMEGDMEGDRDGDVDGESEGAIVMDEAIARSHVHTVLFIVMLKREPPTLAARSEVS